LERSFVPWVAASDDLVAAMWSLPVEVRTDIVPRIAGPASARLVAQLCATCPTVYVDQASAGPGPLPGGAVPVHALGAARGIRADLPTADGPERVAVRVPLARFADTGSLVDDLRSFCAAVSVPPRSIALIVDVPCADRAPSVVATAAAGAVRRARAVAPWNRIVLGLDAVPARTEVPGTMPRPPVALLASTPALADATLAERLALPERTAFYPSASTWFVAPATPGEGGFLAELVTNHREFAGGACCAGDAWVTTATARAETGDVHHWRRAALAHWMTATWRLLQATSPGTTCDSHPCEVT
jgi:hypothetical protein